MTAEQLPAELAEWPAWTPGEAQLGELELITSGRIRPAGRLPASADLAAVDGARRARRRHAMAAFA